MHHECILYQTAMKTIIITALLLILASCEKSDDYKVPDIPDLDSFDIDNDSHFDFAIKYSLISSHDMSVSGHEVISGDIYPLFSNQILYCQTKGPLFLQNNDTIRKENNTISDWISYSASIIGIKSENKKWGKYWTVRSDLNEDYFLGVRLAGETVKIGWILLDPDRSTGRISIIDKGLTASDDLIIQRGK